LAHCLLLQPVAQEARPLVRLGTRQNLTPLPLDNVTPATSLLQTRSAFCNPNGTWGKIENDCVDNPLGQAADWLPFVISGVLGAASVITYFFARKRNPAAQNYLILGTGFSLVELFTDCLFLLQTSMLIGSFDSFSFFLLLVFMGLMPFFFFFFSQSSYLFYASLIALLLSMVMNMVLMLSLLTPEIKRFSQLIF